MPHSRRSVAIATCLSLALLAGCASPTAPTGLNPAAQPPQPDAAPPAAPAAAPSPQADVPKDVWILEGQATYMGAPAANLPITVYDAVTDAPADAVAGGLAVAGGELKTDAEGRYRLAIAGLGPNKYVRLFVNGPDWAISTSVGAEAPASPSYRLRQAGPIVFTNPRTGATTMIVAAGVVRADTSLVTTVVDQATDSPRKMVLVYPAQQINLNKRDEVTRLRTQIETVDVKQLIAVGVAADVISRVLKDKADIDRENREFLEKQRQQLAQQTKPDPVLQGKLQAEQDLASLIQDVVRGAIDRAKVEEVIERANEAIDDVSRHVRLSKEQLAELSGEGSRLASLLEQIKQQHQALEQANRAAMEATQRRADEQLRQVLEETQRLQQEAQREAAGKQKKALEPVSRVIQQSGAQGAINSLIGAALQQAAEAAKQGVPPIAPSVLQAGLPIPGVSGGVGMVDQQAGNLVFTSPTGRQVLLDGSKAGDALQQQIATAVSVPKRSGGGSSAPAAVSSSPLLLGKYGFRPKIDDGDRFDWQLKDVSGTYYARIGDATREVTLNLVDEDPSAAKLALSPMEGGEPFFEVFFEFDVVEHPDDPLTSSRYLYYVGLEDIEVGYLYGIDPELAANAPTRWTTFDGAGDATTHIAYLDPHGNQNELILDAAGDLLAGRIWYPDSVSLPPVVPAYRVLQDAPSFTPVEFWRKPPSPPEP